MGAAHCKDRSRKAFAPGRIFDCKSCGVHRERESSGRTGDYRFGLCSGQACASGRIGGTPEVVGASGLLSTSGVPPMRPDALEERLKLSARVVYCQRLDQGKFAVGLQLDVRVEKWQRQKPPNL